MKNHSFTLFLILCAWAGTGSALGQSPNTAAAWGADDSGQATVPVAAQSGVTAVAAGAEHTVALKTNGTVVAWGSYSHSQIIVPVAAQSRVTTIAAGGLHTVALLGARLDARRIGNELILSWPAVVTGFTLQSTPALTTPSVTWVDVTNAPALLGAQWAVTNTFSGNGQFYRLRKM